MLYSDLRHHLPDCRESRASFPQYPVFLHLTLLSYASVSWKYQELFTTFSPSVSSVVTMPVIASSNIKAVITSNQPTRELHKHNASQLPDSLKKALSGGEGIGPVSIWSSWLDSVLIWIWI